MLSRPLRSYPTPALWRAERLWSWLRHCLHRKGHGKHGRRIHLWGKRLKALDHSGRGLPTSAASRRQRVLRCSTDTSDPASGEVTIMNLMTAMLRAFVQGAQETPAGFFSPVTGLWRIMSTQKHGQVSPPKEAGFLRNMGSLSAAITRGPAIATQRRRTPQQPDIAFRIMYRPWTYPSP